MLKNRRSTTQESRITPLYYVIEKCARITVYNLAPQVMMIQTAYVLKPSTHTFRDSAHPILRVKCGIFSVASGHDGEFFPG